MAFEAGYLENQFPLQGTISLPVATFVGESALRLELAKAILAVLRGAGTLPDTWAEVMWLWLSKPMGSHFGW